MPLLIDTQGYDVTVVNVNGTPLPPQEDSRAVVPHPPHRHPYTQRNWDRKRPILFSTWGHPGVKLSDALDGKFEGIDGRDCEPFNTNYSGITVRIHVGYRFIDSGSVLSSCVQFPGYPSSTDVEKTLKQWAEKGKRSKARSMRVRGGG